ncbi:MAG: NAD(+) synthase [Brevinematia bacterium]
MFNYGFIKVACGIPLLKIADPIFNVEKHLSLIKKADEEGAYLILFPELSLSAYTCGDLFLNSQLIENCYLALKNLVKATENLEILVVAGIPVLFENKLYNSAVAFQKGKILGVVPKSYLPNYKEFYEQRWFTSGKNIKGKSINLNGFEIPFGTDIIFSLKKTLEVSIGIEICEDLWHINPPSSFYAENGATIILNLSASNSTVTKDEYRRLLVRTQSAKTISAYLYCNSGVYESTTDMVFDGSSFIYENGVELASSKRFLFDEQLIFADIDFEFLNFERSRLNTFNSGGGEIRRVYFDGRREDEKLSRKIDPMPFVPKDKEKLEERAREIFNLQTTGLIRRLKSIKNPKAVIGLSGGLDSTLAFLVTFESLKKMGLPPENLKAITMPGFGTSKKTLENVKKLCKNLGVDLEVISIKKLSRDVLNLIKHSEDLRNVVYENTQARARTYLLMMKANQIGGIVIGTGDLSEIALGFCTYNGDHISMYNVNASVPKTLVRFIIEEKAKEYDEKIAKILKEILHQPVSPELLPPEKGEISQRTEEKIGPYELHDFFLYNFARMGFGYKKILFLAKIAFKDKYEGKTIEKWLKVFFDRFVKNQWKRDCVPGGPKVGSVDLSPRSSWRMPAEVDPLAFTETQ